MKFFRPVAKAIRWFWRRAQGALAKADELQTLAAAIDKIRPELGLAEKVARHVGNISAAFQYVEERYGQRTEFFKGLENAYKSGAETYTMNRGQINYVYHLKTNPIEMVKELGDMFGKVKTPVVAAVTPIVIGAGDDGDDDTDELPGLMPDDING